MIIQDNPIYTIIFDVDWAPDFVIDMVVSALIKRNIKTTWYITHSSPAIKRLLSYPDIFEIGIHPNFLPNSSQGKNEDEIIDYCGKIAPNATLLRTHAYYQYSSLFSKIIKELDITSDASIFMPGVPNLQPFRYQVEDRSILRFPIYWEDDYEMKMKKPDWTIPENKLSSPGMKIFAFHPIHIYLNSHSISDYMNLKKTIPDISHVHESILTPFIQKEQLGTRNFFEELTSFVGQVKNYRSLGDISTAVI